jgi:hypothetical protein
MPAGSRNRSVSRGPVPLIMRSKRSLQPLLAGLVAGVVVATMVVAAYQVWKQRRLEGVRNEVLGQLSTLRARLESELNSVIHVTDGMVTYVVLNPDMGEAEFRTIARVLLDRKPGLITHFTAAPDNVIRFLYPEEGNRAALGLDLGAWAVETCGARIGYANDLPPLRSRSAVAVARVAQGVASGAAFGLLRVRCGGRLGADGVSCPL